MPRCAVAALLSLALAATAEATDLAYGRAVNTALASPMLPAGIVENARDACDTALCFAEALATALPDRVRLEPVTHPDTDTIRWVDTPPSVTIDGNGNTLTLRITHFGRKAVTELREVLTSTGENMAVELDLTGNTGGDFERMLKIAGLLLGPVRNAVEIDHGDRIERRSLEGSRLPPRPVTDVRVDATTASAALLLARLLETHAGAEATGPPACKKPVFLKRRITIDHDWRLILPVAELRATGPD